MRRRIGLVLMLIGMLGMRTTGAQLVPGAAVRGLTARQAVWPRLNDGTCLACVARGRDREGASPATAAWSAVTDDSTDKLRSEPRHARFIIEYHRHPVAGAIVGAGVGVVIALVKASNDARGCRGDSCIGPELEPVITIPVFGLAGAVVGGFIGWMIRTE